MKSKAITLILCCAFFLCSITSSFVYAESQAKDTHDKGSHKISIGGSLTSTDQYDANGYYTGTQNQFAAQFAYGYFFLDSVELGISLSGSNNWTNQGSTQFGNFATNAVLKYYFVSEANLVPYLGLLGGTNWTSSGEYSKLTLSGGGTAGAEWLVSDKASFFAEYNLTGHGNDTGSGITNTGIFGLTYHF